MDIRADGVAVIKVKSDMESILAAVEQFNTGKEKETIGVIKDTAKDVLEGKLREIVSKLSVEEIYKDREKFASQVQEVAAMDLAEMGLEIKAFTIRDISDNNGYLEALGKKRIAEVKRDAQIAEAEAMAKKAEAYKQYNDAAVTQMIIEKLPEIAKAVAEPPAKTEKIVVVDSGSSQSKGAARVSGYVTDILASLPETVNALTGINLSDYSAGISFYGQNDASADD